MQSSIDSSATSPPPQSFTIAPALPADIPTIRALFSAYATWLDLDLTFQSFSTELSALPGSYSPDLGGRLLLARSTTGSAIGCVGLRRLSPGVAELKRLYVLDAGRGMGIGRALIEAALQGAREEGCRAVRLDTLPKMAGARRLYAALGFEECERYYETPLEGTVFMELKL